MLILISGILTGIGLCVMWLAFDDRIILSSKPKVQPLPEDWFL